MPWHGAGDPAVDSDRWPGLTFAAESVRRARISSDSDHRRGEMARRIRRRRRQLRSGSGKSSRTAGWPGRRGVKPRSKVPLPTC